MCTAICVISFVLFQVFFSERIVSSVSNEFEVGFLFIVARQSESTTKVFKSFFFFGELKS